MFNAWNHDVILLYRWQKYSNPTGKPNLKLLGRINGYEIWYEKKSYSFFPIDIPSEGGWYMEVLGDVILGNGGTRRIGFGLEKL